MYTITETLQTPCQIDLEITSACNHSCRYCYNFWRHEEGQSPPTRMSRERLDVILDDIIANKVFNVVLTGGEPFLNFEVLLHGVRRLTQAGILVSCNSNLTLATPERLQALKEAGLPHILTSLASHDPEVNDLIFSAPGAFVKIVRAIRWAVAAGIRVSVNTVVSRHSRDHVYKTGLLAAGLGAANLFLTRVVPSTSCGPEMAREFVLAPEEYLPALDDALRLKAETDLNIGSLIQYPVCFLRDVEKYADFLGRGCPAGKKMICLNADGRAHACFHEREDYGNVFDIGLAGVWRNLAAWRDGRLVPPKCRACAWLRWCEGGCRVYAPSLEAEDYMCRDPQGLPRPVEDYEKSLPLVRDGCFQVRPGLRFREESGFWLTHLVGAWIARISPVVAGFLKDREASQAPFTPAEFPEGPESLADLVTKKIVLKLP
jgi:radical SAM protein with 4Fe4S-binding SPASM domain